MFQLHLLGKDSVSLGRLWKTKNALRRTLSVLAEHVSHWLNKVSFQAIIFFAWRARRQVCAKGDSPCAVDTSSLSPGRTGGHTPSWRRELSFACQEQLSNLWSLGLFLSRTGLSPCPWFFVLFCFLLGFLPQLYAHCAQFCALIFAALDISRWIKHSLLLAYILICFIGTIVD